MNTVVDADVHNVLSSNEELFDYLPDYWIHMIRDVGSFPAGGHDWRNPMGLFRQDAVPPGGGLPASDPGYLLQHHLDANKIEYAILTGSCYGLGTAGDKKFPTLRIAALEGGIGWLPHLMWRMGKNFKALRATTPWLKRFPLDYIVEHLRLTTQPVEEPAKTEHLLQIFEMVHAEKTVMFSSDYPHWDNDDPQFAFPRLPETMHRRIFSDNARELYRLPPAVW